MAAGKINLQKASGGVTVITGMDGTGNTDLVLPESGTVATLSNIQGFKNLIINGRKQVNQSGLTVTDNAYNYDNHYKVGNSWFMFIDGKNIISGESYTLSWGGTATASYYIGTVGSLTINAQTFIPIANGETIIPTITSGQILWIKFASDATGSTYNKVQFEPGTTPTPYEQRIYELEESFVQSCYETGYLYGVSYNSSAIALQRTQAFYKCNKRIVPSITISKISGDAILGASTISTSHFIGEMGSTASSQEWYGTYIADARPY